MDYDELKKSVPFDSKREIFAALRESRRNWKRELKRLVKRYGEDAVLWCVAEAVTSSGFNFYPRHWPELEAVIPDHHPAMATVRSRVASSIDLEIELTDDEEEQAFVSILTEVAPKHWDKFATSPERITVLAGSACEFVAHDVVKKFGFDAELACRLLRENNENYNAALWFALARHPKVDLEVLKKIETGPPFERFVATLRARLEREPFSPQVEFDFFGNAPYEPEDVPELQWKLGHDLLPVTRSFLGQYARGRYEVMWISSIVERLKRTSVDELVAIARNDTDWSILRSRVFQGPDTDSVAEIISRCETREQWDDALTAIAADSHLRASCIDEFAVALYEALPDRKNDILTCAIATNYEHRGLTFDEFLELAQDEEDDTFYFKAYSVLTHEYVWFEDMMRLVERRPAGVNEMMIQRHQSDRQLERLVDISNHGEFFAPYVLHAVNFVTGPDVLWDLLEQRVHQWQDQRISAAIREIRQTDAAW